jgi:hypothetical protein
MPVLSLLLFLAAVAVFLVLAFGVVWAAGPFVGLALVAGGLAAWVLPSGWTISRKA